MNGYEGLLKLVEAVVMPKFPRLDLHVQLGNVFLVQTSFILSLV